MTKTDIGIFLVSKPLRFRLSIIAELHLSHSPRCRVNKEGSDMFRCATAGVTLPMLLAFAGLSQAFFDELPGQSTQGPRAKPQSDAEASKQGQPGQSASRVSKEKSKLGVVVNEPGAFQGYTLVFPLQSKKTYLVDMQGRVVRTWESNYTPGQEAYLLENGALLRPAKVSESEALFGGAGGGGRVQEFNWEGKLVWDFKFHNEKQTQHHAITRMPNGNVLLIVWERKTAKQAIAAGVRPEAAGSGEMLVDSLVEINPSGKTGGQIVWEWHVWDHLVQDHDKAKANYGDVALHPELVDVNFTWNTGFANLAQFLPPSAKKSDPKKEETKNDALDKLKGIGYVGAGGGKKFAGIIPDWTHVNAVAYNPKLDQIVVSSRMFSEFWIIDHGTTKAEAAGHSGGRSGKGGDLLYRWGNLQAYRAGTAADQRLFSQHDAHWIPEGLPGAGHILVFSNGGRPDGNYSSVDEIVLPVDAEGKYTQAPAAKFAPEAPVWSYTAPNKPDLFAVFMSGAQRLPNGNTLFSTGFSGTIVEVTPAGQTVWKYLVPNDARPGPGGFAFPTGGGPGGGFPPPGGPAGFGAGMFAGPSRAVQLFPGFLQFFLQLAPEQKKLLEEFEIDASLKVEKMLTAPQKKQLTDMQKSAGGPGGGPPEMGQIMPRPVQDKLNLTADQKEQVRDLQKEADGKLNTVLKEEQKKQFKGMQEMMKLFAAGGPLGFGPGGFGGGFGGSPIFRAYRYGRDYPGLAGRDLTPGKTIEELKLQ
jgi:hypothetical protein